MLENYDYDMFKALEIVPAQGPEDVKGSGIVKFLEIKFEESNMLGGFDGEKIKIVLPFHHEKSISDKLTTSISNEWAKSQNFVTSLVKAPIQELSTDFASAAEGGVLGALANFISTKTMFKYDAGSTQKVIEIPFIVPLGLASAKALNSGATKKFRRIMNDIQGLLYPRGAGFFIPPLMTVTIGGMYRSFLGFVLGVNINPTNPDMFQDPYTKEYFNILYDGTITFSNLFTYYNLGTDSISKFNVQNKTEEVLFGIDPLQSKGSIKDGTLQYYGLSDISSLTGISSNTSLDEFNKLHQDNSVNIRNWDDHIWSNPDIKSVAKIVSQNTFIIKSDNFEGLVAITSTIDELNNIAKYSTSDQKVSIISQLNEDIIETNNALLDPTFTDEEKHEALSRLLNNLNNSRSIFLENGSSSIATGRN